MKISLNNWIWFGMIDGIMFLALQDAWKGNIKTAIIEAGISFFIGRLMMLIRMDYK
jgi:hypothetical protein